jgi:hypothetical protein
MNTELLKHRLDPYCLICAIRRALYSTSVLERDTIGYLRELQEIRLGPRKMTKPLVDRRSSEQPTQLALV